MLSEPRFIVIDEGRRDAPHTSPDCVVLLCGRSATEGFRILDKLAPERGSPPAAIVMLMDGDEATECLALRKGAHEWLPQEHLEASDLRRAIFRAVARRELSAQRDPKPPARDAKRRSIVENEAEMICLSLPDGTLTFVNTAFAQGFGHAPADLEGASLYDFVPETERDGLRRICASLTPGDPVAKHLQQDGVAELSRWLEWTIRLLPGCDGAGAEYQFNVRDITARKRAGDALRRSQERFEAIINTAMDAIVSVDDEQRIVLFNSAAAALFMYPAEDAIGKSLDHFIPERFRTAHKQHILRFGESGESMRKIKSRDPIFALRSDGVEVLVDASISLARVEGRTLFSVIMRDVTARAQAAQVLRESEERFRNLIATVPGVIFTSFQDSAGKQSIPYASPQTKALLGLDPEQLRLDLQPFFRFVHPDDLDHLVAAIRDAIQARGAWREEFRYHHPEKGLIWLEGQSSPEADPCKGLVWHGYLRDVTEHKAAQARIKKNVAERVKSLKAMAAGLAHELNQPLAAGMAFLESARHLAGMEPQRRPVSINKVLSDATDQIVRAAGILARLREFIAHSESNKTNVKLHDLIEKACLVINQMADQCRINLRLHLDARDDIVLADAVQIEQVLGNLLRNAIDAIGDCATREIIVTTWSDETEIRVDLCDSGTGFSQKAAADLFEPFVTTKASGMGVGLFFSRSMIEAQGGKLTASSNEGAGATFSFTIPLASREATDGEAGALKWR
ncbi:PAS domain S-box protein [Methylocapsa palsarum]|nr:PAS domain S-box protein [Methylocapsa palsarum]